MAKYIQVDTNPLKSGMTFNTLREVGEFINCKDIKHGNAITSALNHYCNWHRADDNVIVIDDCFDVVKPFRTKGFRYDIGEIIQTSTGKYEIIDHYYKQDKYRNNVKAATYLCRCLIHNNFEFELTENRITQGIGCPLCGNKKLVPGVRSLYDNYPELMKYVVDNEEAKRITPSANKKILCKCPLCGTKREILVGNLTRTGFSCSYCSDHISYPNKFVRCMLKQLNIDYLPEKSFDWSEGRIYDQYLLNQNIIIENHGLQHYEECSGFSMSLSEQIENDELKQRLAFENGISEYVILDCSKSEKDFIKSSILSSKLPILLNFQSSDIDWDLCDEIASTNSEFINVCNIYNNITKNISEIAEITKHDIHTVIGYLAKAASFGYCDYEKNVTTKETRLNAIRDVHSKPIYCITDNIYFYSKFECEQYYKSHGIQNFYGSGLYIYINAEKPYYGKIFKYISKQDYNKYFDDDNYMVIGEKYNERYIKEV